MGFLENRSIEKNFKFLGFSVVFYCKFQRNEKLLVLAFSACVCVYVHTDIHRHVHLCVQKSCVLNS